MEDSTLLNKESLSSIQKLLLCALNVFNSLCEKQNLTYFLCGGSALGAVRHEGFIPWDDDADVSMPREDFELIIPVLRTELCNEKLFDDNLDCMVSYSLEDPINTQGYGVCFARLHVSAKGYGSATLDIFALENSPDGFLASHIHGIKCLAAGFFLACARDASAFELFIEHKNLLTTSRKLRLYVGKYLHLNVDKCRVHAWNIYGAYFDKETNYVTAPTGRAHYFGERFSREELFPPRKVKFENLTLSAMNDIDTYLTRLYGNYMEIPKNHERETHVLIGDVEVSVKNETLE